MVESVEDSRLLLLAAAGIRDYLGRAQLWSWRLLVNDVLEGVVVLLLEVILHLLKIIHLV